MTYSTESAFCSSLFKGLKAIKYSYYLNKISDNRERRKVQLVEQPGQKVASRGPQVTRVFSTTQGRPLSADDIQKAKMRAQFMRSKYGESYVNPQVKTEVPRVSSTSQAKMTISPSKPHVRPKVEEHVTSSSSTTTLPDSPVRPIVEEHKPLVNIVSGDEMAVPVPVHGKEDIDSEEPVLKKCKRMQISWVNPPGIFTFIKISAFFFFLFVELMVCRSNGDCVAVYVLLLILRLGWVLCQNRIFLVLVGLMHIRMSFHF